MYTYLLSGSFAYDSVLLHRGEFHTKMPRDGEARLNVVFGVDSYKQEYGGTGGNIAYNASLLGDGPLLIGSVGEDADSYLRRLDWHSLDVGTLTRVPDAATAHAWILTDSVNNQIAAFAPGAMRVKPKVPEQTPELWHLAPEDPTTTAWLARRAHAERKTYFFDPGQALPAFIAGDADGTMPLAQLLRHAEGVFLNDNEAAQLSEDLDQPAEECSWMISETQFLAVTRGAAGVDVYSLAGHFHVDIAAPREIVDPTGCGDALRAGFLHGFVRDWPLLRCTQLGVVMSSFAIEASGGQNHKPTREAILDRMLSFAGPEPDPVADAQADPGPIDP